MTRVCWRPVIQRYEEFNLCKSNCETKKKNLTTGWASKAEGEARMTLAWKLRAKSVTQRSARATESVSLVQKRFSQNHEGLKEFQRQTSAFVLRFNGQLIYRLVTVGSFPGPCHLNQLLYPVESVFNLLTLFRMKCYAHSLSFKSQRVWNFEISYCRFARDVMAAMLVVSPLVTQ